MLFLFNSSDAIAVVPLPALDPNITCVTAFAPVPKLIVSATLTILAPIVANVNDVSDGKVAVPDTTKFAQTIPPTPILC